MMPTAATTLSKPSIMADQSSKISQTSWLSVGLVISLMAVAVAAGSIVSIVYGLRDDFKEFSKSLQVTREEVSILKSQRAEDTKTLTEIKSEVTKIREFQQPVIRR